MNRRHLPKKVDIMEYSKDIIIGLNYLNGEDKQAKEKSRIMRFMNEHKFITSITITCLILIILDCFLVYNFIELLQEF